MMAMAAQEAESVNLVRLIDAMKGSYALADGKWYPGTLDLTTQPIEIKERTMTVSLYNALRPGNSRIIFWKDGKFLPRGFNLSTNIVTEDGYTFTAPADATHFTVSIALANTLGVPEDNSIPIVVLCQVEYGAVKTPFRPNPADAGKGVYRDY